MKRSVGRVNGPVSRATANSLGIDDNQLRRQHLRLLRGHWKVDTTRLRLEEFWQAGLNCGPDDAFLSHHTAAALHGGVVPATGEVEVGTLTGRRVRVRGLVVHRYTRAPEIVTVRGMPVTSKEQTFLDLAARLSLVDLVVLGDSFARSDVGFPERLPTATGDARGRGAVNARRAAKLVRARVESPQESRLRLLVVLAGLPEPTVQVELLDAEGFVVYRLDLAYGGFRLAIEYDGRAHVERQGQWEKDLLRRESVEGGGWRFVVAVSADIYRRPEQFLDRLVAAMRSVGMRPPRLDPQWRLHFPC
ncbi:hypothetical protein HJ588_01705 [Flexivirga sp. ID2601S]|uniref:DUF559 domain-containing protein n=1 Tax=Flexivirga aerilata TaxID=1656889 RepID=A0A849AMF0_9MICO|nr:hypothetical protein [Flexivirga aerilata]NNG37992.1 hypothetical protein [Flexivirga aerilata]